MADETPLNLALEHHKAGRVAEAEAIYRRILADHPDHPDAMHLLGVLIGQAGRREEAVDFINGAISLRPRMAVFHHNLGLNLSALRRTDEAIAAYRRALELNPDYPKALHNLAALLKQQGNLDEAISFCRKAVTLAPNYAEAQNSLGTMLLAKGNLDAACTAYRQAVAHQPDYHQAWFNLGVALQQKNDVDDAIAAYTRAIELNPQSTESLTNLGVMHKLSGRLPEAVQCYQRAMELTPDNTVAHSNLIYLLEFHPDISPEEVWVRQQEFERRHAAPLRPMIRPHDNDRSPNRRLKIGYLSPDFRHHVVGTNLLPLLREHDHAQFEIIAYATVPASDSMTQRLQAFTDGWRDLTGMDDQKAADLIRADKVDILIDLTLHMSDNRLLLMARKPAPVQVSYLGYCGTTGLTAIDYRLSDPHLDPPDQPLPHYSEQTIRLPVCYWCYQRPDPAPPIAPPPALKLGHVTFGCMNNYAKVSPAALDVWADVLAAVPDSRLLLHALPGRHRDDALQRFAAKNVDPARIEFIGRKALWQYLQTYHKIDVALDPFPYGGGITTCDGLWMGVPIVTLSSRTAVGRGGRSILANIGLPQWIAGSPSEYVRLAVDLAGDLPRLNDLRFRMRERMLTSGLMDAKRFARDIEAAYRKMWHNWCGVSP